jgi:predicted MFS family arabinose efflux permease
MGRYNTAFYSAVAVGPLIGGFLYELYGLKALFYLWAVLGLVSMIIVAIRITEPSRHEGSVTCRKGAEGLLACTEKQY